jgi:hypothetical protein
MNNYVKSIVVKKQTDEIIEFLEQYIKGIKELSIEVNRQQFINEIFSGSYLEKEIKKIVELYVD